MHTIENPPIPFNYPIHGGMLTGSELVLHGATYNGNRKQFHINLLGQNNDVVLHFNPRFKFFEDTIVLNTRTYAGWGTEERHRNRMSLGDTFRIRLVCHHSHFLVIVNDKEVGNFEHRLSPQMIHGLEVDGDLTLHRILMINFQQSQAPQPYAPAPYVPPPYVPPSAPPAPPQYTVISPAPSYMPSPPPAPWAPPNQQYDSPTQNAAPPPSHPHYQHHCHHCGSRGCHQCRH